MGTTVTPGQDLAPKWERRTEVFHMWSSPDPRVVTADTEEQGAMESLGRSPWSVQEWPVHFFRFFMAGQASTVDLEAGDELAGMGAAERYEFVVQHIPSDSREDFLVEVAKAAFEAVEKVSIGHLAHALGGWEATAYIYAHPETAEAVTQALSTPSRGPGVHWRELEQELCGE